MKPDDDSRVLHLTLRDTKELRLMKNECALLESSCPSVPRHTFARRTPRPCPRSPATECSAPACGPSLPSVGSHL